MVSCRSSVSWAAGSRKTLGGDGVSKALNAGEPSYRDERHLGPRISPVRKLDGGGLRSVVSDFPVFYPASWVGIFCSAFISLSSSQLCSAIYFLWFLFGDTSSQAPPLAPIDPCIPLSSRVLACGSVHLLRVHPLLPCAMLASLVNLGSYGLRLVVHWRMRILSGCLSRGVSHGVTFAQEWHRNH
jgi:hypothetical protein